MRGIPPAGGAGLVAPAAAAHGGTCLRLGGPLLAIRLEHGLARAMGLPGGIVAIFSFIVLLSTAMAHLCLVTLAIRKSWEGEW